MFNESNLSMRMHHVIKIIREACEYWNQKRLMCHQIYKYIWETDINWREKLEFIKIRRVKGSVLFTSSFLLTRSLGRLVRLIVEQKGAGFWGVHRVRTDGLGVFDRRINSSFYPLIFQIPSIGNKFFFFTLRILYKRIYLFIFEEVGIPKCNLVDVKRTIISVNVEIDLKFQNIYILNQVIRVCLWLLSQTT